MRKIALIVLIIGGAISVGLQLANRTGSSSIPQELVGIVLPEARPLSPFTLTDHNQAPFDLSRLKGQWTFLFFGYTHCPDICPTALGQLAEVFDGLKGEKEILATTQVLFVSVDPERDRPETLKEYVPYFNPDFIGATGTTEQIQAFSKQLGAVYLLSPDQEGEGNYQVAHTSSFFLINPKGAFYALFQPAHFSPEKITQSYLTMRRLP